ncbi:helix-turn-helix domain-containing protein [Providencia hangzhouensis]|uniref:helix-turn-helix domain-containing protein n=1 Tax=Providencia hangzhouensis TaxID=3031799 RepID=UPI0034DD36BE
MKKKKDTTYYISQLVGKCLQEYRQELGISGENIAKELGISQQQLSRYERGENALTVDVLIILYSVLISQIFTIKAILCRESSS